MIEIDPTSAIVGAVVTLAATFGAAWGWYHLTESPSERARRRLRAWEAKAERRYE